MKKLLLITSMFALAAIGGEWKGSISDSKCGAGHVDGSEKSVACVKGCIKSGATPVFVSDGKIYKIANPETIKDHYGHKVTLKGTMANDTVTVESVSMD